MNSELRQVLHTYICAGSPHLNIN